MRQLGAGSRIEVREGGGAQQRLEMEPNHLAPFEASEP